MEKLYGLLETRIHRFIVYRDKSSSKGKLCVSKLVRMWNNAGGIHGEKTNQIQRTIEMILKPEVKADLTSPEVEVT
ncbi:MAG: hypothetical protein GY839_19520 [candidate division Zixibacteria bacterium]|nr:hypothetical protein [candidate division Zixibacteria bacterium]